MNNNNNNNNIFVFERVKFFLNIFAFIFGIITFLFDISRLNNCEKFIKNMFFVRVYFTIFYIIAESSVKKFILFLNKFFF